ncbi:uncharacterized protein [Magallana gigas]|uniref:uncharacterized protein n=1 Tax=Magallana gigas TaxID=29159 RepID=UPI00334050BC
MCNGTYLYHCLIDTNINELVEVCAERNIIHLGSCTEFSLSAFRIIPNYNKNCSKFPDNPCPIPYNSTMAYKYPGCYELKKPRNEKETTPLNTSSTFTNQTKVYNQNGTFSDHDATSALTRTLRSLIFLLIIRLVLMPWI